MHVCLQLSHNDQVFLIDKSQKYALCSKPTVSNSILKTIEIVMSIFIFAGEKNSLFSRIHKLNKILRHAHLEYCWPNIRVQTRPQADKPNQPVCRLIVSRPLWREKMLTCSFGRAENRAPHSYCEINCRQTCEIYLLLILDIADDRGDAVGQWIRCLDSFQASQFKAKAIDSTSMSTGNQSESRAEWTNRPKQSSISHLQRKLQLGKASRTQLQVHQVSRPICIS